MNAPREQRRGGGEQRHDEHNPCLRAERTRIVAPGAGVLDAIEGLTVLRGVPSRPIVGGLTAGTGGWRALAGAGRR